MRTQGLTPRDHLIYTMSRTPNDGTATAVAALAASGDWTQSVPFGLLTQLVKDDSLAEALVSQLSHEELGGMMLHFSNAVRKAVLQRSKRAPVLNGLAVAPDMDDEVLNVFLAHAGQRALRAFLSAHGPRDIRGPYPAEVTLQAWLRLLRRYHEIGRDVPAAWSRGQLREAIDVATKETPDTLGRQHLRFPAMTLWQAGELAGVVSPTAREVFTEAMATVRGPGAGDDDTARHNAAPEVRAFRMYDPEPLLDADLIAEVSTLKGISFLQRHPRFDEFLGKCTDGVLCQLFQAGVPLDRLLPHASNRGTVVMPSYASMATIGRTEVPADVILELPPVAATRVAAQHAGAADSTWLAGHVAGSLSEDALAWQFFWDSYSDWEGSLADLLSTSRAVSS